VTDEESIMNFETSVTRASAINNATLIIGGDMNFPGWNWKENTLKPNSTAPNLHTDFMDVLNSTCERTNTPTKHTGSDSHKPPW
jgi:hypothetical protein